MGSGATNRLSLEYPLPSDPTNIPGDIQTLATQIDGEMVVFTSGLLASRPLAGVGGVLYWTTDTLSLYYDNQSSWVLVGGGQVAGTVLATVYYAPSLVTYNTTSASLAPIDTTNLVFPAVTVPTSGKLLVRWSGYFYASAASTQLNLGLTVGGSQMTGSLVHAAIQWPSGEAQRCFYEEIVSGLAALSSQTIQLAWSAPTGGTQALAAGTGNFSGAPVMGTIQAL